MSEPERGFTLSRILDAPREAVFQAWTDPGHLQWFSSPVAAVTDPIEVDLRIGGVWRQKMVVDDDTQYFTGGVYREIAPPERLSFTWGAFDGWPKIDPDHPEDGPVVTVTLHELGAKTEMVFHLQLPDHLSEVRVREWFAQGVEAGWSDTIDRLVKHFAGVATN
jgi:uncharacterized protein YndB with AHSA1/START domain